MNDNDDKRPDPKPRKHPQLWQAYLWWDEIVEMRKRHNLRIGSIEAGKSNMDAGFEYMIVDDMRLDYFVEQSKKQMAIWTDATVGPIWGSLTSIKGLAAGGLAAQVLAQIDDITSFSTVSKLWRFSGYAVIDGQAERNKKGEKSHFNRRLKSTCWLVGQQFIRQQTPGYVDLYYSEKDRQRKIHPEKIKVDGKWKYNDGHLHNMAQRKMVKIFLQHLWLTWRELEGLPVSLPYAHDQLGHGTLYTPAEYGWREPVLA